MAAVKKYGTAANTADAEARRAPGSKTDTNSQGLSSIESQGRDRRKAQGEPGLESKDIQVTLTTDAVKLSGSVVSTDDRDKAVRIAKVYAGDREVQDHLTIQTP